MFKLMLGFISGVILLYFSGELINSSKESLNYCDDLRLLFVTLSGFLLILSYLMDSGKCLEIILIVVFFLLGFSYALTEKTAIKSAFLPTEYEQQTLRVSAYLCSIPRETRFSLSAEFCILNLETPQGFMLPGKGYRARMNWQTEDLTQVNSGIHVYEVQVKSSRTTSNFVGPSFEDILLYRKMVLDGKIKSISESIDLNSLPLSSRMEFKFHQIRLSLSMHGNGFLTDFDHSGVVNALLLGDKSGLNLETRKSLMSSGTMHLVAISGLHVGLVMMAFLSVFPKHIVAYVVTAVFGGIYVLLVGAPPSAQRAWVMSVCVLIYLSGFVNLSRWQTFIAALFFVLLIDPLATFNPGFWFSFLCVAMIFLLLEWQIVSSRPLFLMIYFQIGITLALVPLASYLGMKHGLESLLANFLAIPWVSFVVLPLTLIWYLFSFIFTGISNFVLRLLDISIEILMAYLTSLRGISFPLMIDANPWLFCFFVFVGLIVLFLARFRSILMIGSLVLCLVLAYPSRLYESPDELLLFDVGQGLAMAIKSQDKVWLYDTGPAFETGSSVQNTVLPYLRLHQKHAELKGVVVSHGDADHAGDVKGLIEGFYPEFLWSGQPERIGIMGVKACVAGMNFRDEGLQIEVIYPFASGLKDFNDSNNQSCVIKVKFLERVFLFMGDLEGDAEYELVRHYRDSLKADVLIAGHHGASKSSSYALLKHVQPDYVVFSAGYLNKFGHPSIEVRQRLNAFDAVSINTAESGAIRFRLSSKFELLVDQARSNL